MIKTTYKWTGFEVFMILGLTIKPMLSNLRNNFLSIFLSNQGVFWFWNAGAYPKRHQMNGPQDIWKMGKNIISQLFPFGWGIAKSDLAESMSPNLTESSIFPDFSYTLLLFGMWFNLWWTIFVMEPSRLEFRGSRLISYTMYVKIEK